VAEWVGHGVAVLLDVCGTCIDGQMRSSCAASRKRSTMTMKVVRDDLELRRVLGASLILIYLASGAMPASSKGPAFRPCSTLAPSLAPSHQPFEQ
jgi:hypothetical protein